MKNDAASRKIQTPSTRADDRTLTLAFARYARKHNEYASTVRSNPELRAAAVREWNESIDQKAKRALKPRPLVEVFGYGPSAETLALTLARDGG